MKSARLLLLYLAIASTIGIGLCAQRTLVSARSDGSAPASLTAKPLKEWLTYLSSDALEGRGTFSEGLGLAAAYISERLREAGVRPGGDEGTYFQRVSVLGVDSDNNSSLTVEVNGTSRTFKNGEGVTFPKNVGGKRTLTLNDVEFIGYGLNLGPNQNDFKDRDVKGKAVVWLGPRGPRAVDRLDAARVLQNRTSVAVEELGAAAVIGPIEDLYEDRNSNNPDFTTTQRLDLPQTPAITANEEFLTFLFSAADTKYAALKAKSDQREALPTFTLKGVKLTFRLDADYDVVNTRYTRNVVGFVEGSDPALSKTFVAFGAHYDHLGYQQGSLARGVTDRIWNGADDDGSGTATLIGLAHAFAGGEKPRRSLLFVWHAGEELGLYGSRYFADYPTVAIEEIVAQLNIDMIGRNRDNKDNQNNTVSVVGSDRISTELHNLMIDANSGLPMPMSLDYGMNDPMDPERIYYRSDHYSYAAKGIPVIFFFTGLHSDYHRVSDSVEKINFEKMARIGQLVFELGRRLANLDHAPARDFKGPRVGKTRAGKIEF